MGRHTSSHSESPPTKGRGSSPYSRKRSPVPSSRRDREREKDREKSPSTRRHRSSHARKAETSPPRGRSISPPPSREKKHLSSRESAKLVRDNSRSPGSRSRSPSPSPRTKRLKRAQADRERERVNERDHGIGRGSDRERDRGRSDRDMGSERKDKRGYKKDEDTDNLEDNGRSRSSRSRHERVASSPERHRNGRSRHRSQSPQNQAAALDEVTNSRGAADRNDENDSMTKMKAAEEALEAKQQQKPSFELSGNLAAETNRVRGVTLLYNEPPEARKPDIKWRLYVFKSGEVLNEPLYIHRQSSYLFGRERRVADIPTDHPSCSKQHAVIQFRQVEKEQPDGLLLKQIRPYLMDLGSTNKTYVNDSPIEPQRYYELRERDTIKFGNSSREYVLLHENSAG